jgi:hypothetical protein
MRKVILITLITLITNQAFAVCSTRAVDSNTRIISLAKDYAEQADVEFKKENAIRGCELLHVSRSFINQSDNKQLIHQIVSLYNKKCGEIKTQDI